MLDPSRWEEAVCTATSEGMYRSPMGPAGAFPSTRPRSGEIVYGELALGGVRGRGYGPFRWRLGEMDQDPLSEPPAPRSSGVSTPQSPPLAGPPRLGRSVGFEVARPGSPWPPKPRGIDGIAARSTARRSVASASSRSPDRLLSTRAPRWRSSSPGPRPNSDPELVLGTRPKTAPRANSRAAERPFRRPHPSALAEAQDVVVGQRFEIVLVGELEAGFFDLRTEHLLAGPNVVQEPFP